MIGGAVLIRGIVIGALAFAIAFGAFRLARVTKALGVAEDSVAVLGASVKTYQDAAASSDTTIAELRKAVADVIESARQDSAALAAERNWYRRRASLVAAQLEEMNRGLQTDSTLSCDDLFSPSLPSYW